jgi:hypothetical protein
MTTIFSRRILLALLLSGALVLTGCDSTNSDGPDLQEGIVHGPAKALGNGSVNAFVERDAMGAPVALGVRLTETALTGLPAHGALETVLALPAEASIAPYNHVSVDWQPHGHEPDGVYTLPHFDLHFYFISETERAAITPADPAFDEKASRAPAPQYVLAGYVPVPGAVPLMGAHWVDPTSPEFTGEGFSRTFLFGSWDGRVTFWEPMITKAFIESVKQSPSQTVSFSIPQPQAVETAGFYPGHYTVRYDADAQTYEIILGDLTERPAA